MPSTVRHPAILSSRPAIVPTSAPAEPLPRGLWRAVSHPCAFANAVGRQTLAPAARRLAVFPPLFAVPAQGLATRAESNSAAADTVGSAPLLALRQRQRRQQRLHFCAVARNARPISHIIGVSVRRDVVVDGIVRPLSHINGVSGRCGASLFLVLFSAGTHCNSHGLRNLSFTEAACSEVPQQRRRRL